MPNTWTSCSTLCVSEPEQVQRQREECNRQFTCSFSPCLGWWLLCETFTKMWNLCCNKGRLLAWKKTISFLFHTNWCTQHCPGWPMAKPDSKFFFIIWRKRGLNNLRKCVTVKYVPCYLGKAPVFMQNTHTCKKKKRASWMSTMSCCTINTKRKTCNEIGTLPSVRNVTAPE